MLIMLDAMNKKLLLSKNATTNDNNTYTTLIAGSPWAKPPIMQQEWVQEEMAPFHL